MRKLGAVLATALMLVAFAGCTKKSSDSSTKTTDSTESSTTTTASDSSSGNSSSDGSSSDSIPSLSNLGDCMQAYQTFIAAIANSSLFTQGDTGGQDLAQQFDELKAQAPPDIQGDLQTLADGAQNADSLMAWSEFISSDQAQQAVDNVSNWLENQCGN